MPDMERVMLCDNSACVARGACYLYRARPKDSQPFQNFAGPDGRCASMVRVEPWMLARGVVMDTKVADALHKLAEEATDVTPTREKEKA